MNCRFLLHEKYSTILKCIFSLFQVKNVLTLWFSGASLGMGAKARHPRPPNLLVRLLRAYLHIKHRKQKSCLRTPETPENSSPASDGRTALQTQRLLC